MGQGSVLFIFFFLLSLIEIALFMAVGDIIGFWGTLLMVVITAMIGAKLARSQGISVLLSAQQTVAQGKTPVKEIYAGICILMAGALLITPGFLTDGIGILLLVPAFRSLLGIYIADKIISKINVASFHSSGGGGGFGANADFTNSNFKGHFSHTFDQNPNQNPNDDIIDGDFQQVNNNKSDINPEKSSEKLTQHPSDKRDNQ